MSAFFLFTYLLLLLLVAFCDSITVSLWQLWFLIPVYFLWSCQHLVRSLLCAGSNLAEWTQLKTKPVFLWLQETVAVILLWWCELIRLVGPVHSKSVCSCSKGVKSCSRHKTIIITHKCYTGKPLCLKDIYLWTGQMFRMGYPISWNMQRSWLIVLRQ